MRILQCLKLSLLQQNLSSQISKVSSLRIPFGPFSLFIQKRWKKPVISARTRLEDRIRDTQFDKLVYFLRRLNTILHLHELMTHRKHGPFVSTQMMSRWRNFVGINVGIGTFLRKYPHIFEIFNSPVRHNLCCRMTKKMLGLIKEEASCTKQWESEAVYRVKRLLKMSRNGSLHVHALRLIRRELGLPEDFRDSIISKYSNEFKLVDLEVVELVDRDVNVEVAEIEKWREKEFREKWLSELETKYAFPINFPTGHKIERGFREKLKNWQRLPYIKPYERKEVLRVRTCGGIERYEKRAVGILHELLSLTVEKMVAVDKLAHFRKDFAILVNLRELLLKHPGIFYISIKGNTQTVFLREAYSKGCLLVSNPIYEVRRKMLDLILLSKRNTRELHVPKNTEVLPQNLDCRVNGDSKGDDILLGKQNTRELRIPKNTEVLRQNIDCRVNGDSKRDGDWVTPLLENLNGENSTERSSDVVVSSVEQFDDKL